MKFTALLFGVLFSLSQAWGADQVIKSDAEKLSYAIGHQIGQNLMRNVKRDNIDIDIGSLTQAIEDVLTGAEPKLSAAERQAVVQIYHQKAQKSHAMIATKNQQDGEKFLTENKQREGVTTTSSGLQYRVIKAGNGKQPESNATVVVHYRGKLLDGNEFDSSYQRNEPATFPINGVIKGWQEALPLMKEGAHWELFIPPQLAYGSKGAGSRIGPNQTLVFDVELLEVK